MLASQTVGTFFGHKADETIATVGAGLLLSPIVLRQGDRKRDGE